MAYFCRLYILSEALTPDFMLCDLFGLNIFLVFFSPPNQVYRACVSLVAQTCLIYPSPKGLEPSCHGDGTQVFSMLPRHPWCHHETGRGNRAACTCTLYFNAVYFQQISGSPSRAAQQSLSHKRQFTQHRAAMRVRYPADNQIWSRNSFLAGDCLWWCQVMHKRVMDHLHKWGGGDDSGWLNKASHKLIPTCGQKHIKQSQYVDIYMNVFLNSITEA